MPIPDARLGVIIDANKLFYAVSLPGKPGAVNRIGSIDFSFDLSDSIAIQDPDTYPGISETLNKLIHEYEISDVRMVFPPFFECWSILPKSVYDEEKERFMHMNILMQGTDIRDTRPYWHALSNRDYKMLAIRRNEHIDSFVSLMNDLPNGNLYSDFEIGLCWMKYTQFRGSFLSVSANNGILSISSFLLGKLRAATYIKFDDINDLPYLWLQYASHLPWMQGLHEYIMVYGNHSGQIVENLKTYWDDSSDIRIMNTLKKMTLTCDEETFSFPLERAFPAALLSVS